jgi:hypothetical protein
MPVVIRVARALIVSILLVVGCAQDNSRATCSALDDASGIVCTSTVADCISDGGGICEINKADYTLDLDVDGTYSEITSAHAVAAARRPAPVTSASSR